MATLDLNMRPRLTVNKLSTQQARGGRMLATARFTVAAHIRPRPRDAQSKHCTGYRPRPLSRATRPRPTPDIKRRRTRP
eukprot:10317338-Alexandrium_andersonii.AAC.1